MASERYNFRKLNYIHNVNVRYMYAFFETSIYVDG